MPITQDETAAAIEAIEAGTPLTEIPAFKELGQAVVIRTTKQEVDYKEGLLDSGVEEKIKPRIAEMHNQYDKDIEEITGLKRPADQKSYEHLKAVLTGQKTKAAELEGSISALKAAGGDTAKLEETHQKAIQTLEGGFQERLDAKSKEFEDFKSKATQGQQETSIRNVM